MDITILSEIVWLSIKYNNGGFNSIELAEYIHNYIHNITDSQVRNAIQYINSNPQEYEFGIISKEGKYHLATEQEDIDKIIARYNAQYNKIKNKKELWEVRRLQLLGDRFEEEYDFDTIEEAEEHYYNELNGGSDPDALQTWLAEQKIKEVDE